MAKFKRPFLYVLLILISLFISLFLAGRNSFIDKQAAIERAQLYCAQTHSEPKETPHNFKAELLACSEAEKQTAMKCTSSTKVWLVLMDGLWFHQGPPNADSTNSAPITYTKCSVLMNAATGEMIALSSK